ncbi:MAG TPA: DUF2721 domain-containing protein [Bryobacteraceae bacterium]|nr:DUF2721 domain-containing protein [Bryobacteraceae bacterium]
MLASVTPNDPLQVLAAGVTPVVLVSSTAILISGVNSRYIAISDRIRALAHEYRYDNCTEERRRTIAREMRPFHRRVTLVARAVRALYAAVGCFITMALIISATLWRSMLGFATLPLFFLGCLLILIAIVFQLLELQISNGTITTETQDITEKSL